MPSPSQLELFQADPTWFHFFRDLIISGKWARMSFPAKSVYPCVKSHCNYESGIAFPSIDRLARLSGVSIPSVLKALRELEELDLLSAEKQTGKSTIYRIKEIIQPTDGNGKPAGNQISFNYVPNLTAKTLDQLREYLKNGRNTTFNLFNITINNVVTVQNLGEEHSSIDSAKVLQGVMDRIEGIDSDFAKYVSAIESGLTP